MLREALTTPPPGRAKRGGEVLDAASLRADAREQKHGVGHQLARARECPGAVAPTTAPTSLRAP